MEARAKTRAGMWEHIMRTEFSGMWWHELQLNQETKEEGASYAEKHPCIQDYFYFFSAHCAYKRITLALQNGPSPLLEGGWLQGWKEAVAQDS